MKTIFGDVLEDFLNIGNIKEYAAEIKNDLDTEKKKKKKGLIYYSKYNPFELKDMFDVIQKYTARATWPDGYGISYSGNNEKTME